MVDAPRHLSYSRINRYLHCPEQYRLYYIENLRRRLPSASLVFGKTVHQALAHFFATKNSPAEFFLSAWDAINQNEITFGARESWQKLRESGSELLTQFIDNELPRIGRVSASEQPFELNISTLDQPFIGIIDLVAEVDGASTVVDFKTSGQAYAPHQAHMSDQLIAYQLAHPDAERAALCVLIKTKQPKIEWYFTEHSSEQLLEYLAKAKLVAREITDGKFYKRPGMWCAWCDYLPVCMGDMQKVEDTLMQLP